MRYLPELFANNRRWAEGRTQADPGFFTRLAAQQAPDYLWIGCADSRVPANEIVGLDPGELFVHRNVANLVPIGDANALAVIQFAVDALGVEHIIVCGHYRCGGVEAAFGPPQPQPLEGWLRPVRRLRQLHGAELDALEGDAARARRLCEINVVAQVAEVCRLSTVMAAWQRGQPLVVHGWIYDVADGLLHDLDVSAADPAEIPAPDGESP